ncbi:MAG TPA: transglycosylase SLT domain-containing protein [Acidimicrobiia bacterium]|nr:transglycosylase SLT domain-containing protein [Acidimicrobiia bacterium]
MGWVLVSLLAVAGFAAFSADDQADDPDAARVGDLGRTAGIVTALAFAGTADTTPTSMAPTLESDPTIATAAELGLRSRRPTETPTTETRGGIYVRSGHLTETEVRGLVVDHFRPADVNRAIRVAWCQSSFNPAAVNPSSGASGLFQHLPEDWATRAEAAGHPGASIFDPTANVAVAAWMLYDLPGGWSHWDCSP